MMNETDAIALAPLIFKYVVSVLFCVFADDAKLVEMLKTDSVVGNTVYVTMSKCAEMLVETTDSKVMIVAMNAVVDDADANPDIFRVGPTSPGAEKENEIRKVLQKRINGYNAGGTVVGGATKKSAASKPRTVPKKRSKRS